MRGGLVDVVRVDGEVLAQDGELYGGSRGFEIGQISLEMLFVRQHG